jgi:hypothetical protein
VKLAAWASVNVSMSPQSLGPFSLLFWHTVPYDYRFGFAAMARSDRANAATFVTKAHIAITHWCERARYPMELRFGNSVELTDK